MKLLLGLLMACSVYLGKPQSSTYNAPGDVYVCMSSTAYAYHNNRHCRGLKQCTHKIETMSERTAKQEYKRKPCGYCY